ncbi:MAG: SRPBCC family protein [Pseudomonadota bacterium]
MAEARVVKKVNAPAADVWAQLGVFDSIKPGGPIEAVRYEGQGVGMVRYLTMGGGQVVERLEEHDAAHMTFTYAIINEDCPLPFNNYSATVKITDDGDDTCTVDWTGTFDARGDEAAAVNLATGIYAGGIKGARIALGVD